MATPKELYALVQHSGYVGGGNGQFKSAVEQVLVSEKRAERIKSVGGLVFADYSEADDAAMAENYPPEVKGMIPRVRGTFHKTMKVDGMAVYIPAPKKVEVAR